MGDSRIKDVSALLSAFFDGEKLRRGERYSDFFSSWPSFVGPRLASHTRVIDVDKGLLVVEAEHPGWIQLLQLRQTEVLEAVSRKFPELGLRGIAFRLSGQGNFSKASGATAPSGAASPPAGAGKGEEGGEEDLKFPEESPAAADIEDPEFKALFSSLKKTMQGRGRGGQPG